MESDRLGDVGLGDYAEVTPGHLASDLQGYGQGELCSPALSPEVIGQKSPSISLSTSGAPGDSHPVWGALTYVRSTATSAEGDYVT